MKMILKTLVFVAFLLGLMTSSSALEAEAIEFEDYFVQDVPEFNYKGNLGGRAEMGKPPKSKPSPTLYQSTVTGFIGRDEGNAGLMIPRVLEPSGMSTVTKRNEPRQDSLISPSRLLLESEKNCKVVQPERCPTAQTMDAVSNAGLQDRCYLCPLFSKAKAIYRLRYSRSPPKGPEE